MWQQKGCSGYMDPHTDRFPFVGVGKQTLRFDLFRHRVFILRTSPYQSFSVFGRRLAPLPPSPHRLWLDLVLFVTFIEGEFLVHRNLITTNSNLSKWSSSWSTIKLLVSFFICPLFNVILALLVNLFVAWNHLPVLLPSCFRSSTLAQWRLVKYFFPQGLIFIHFSFCIIILLTNKQPFFLCSFALHPAFFRL